MSGRRLPGALAAARLAARITPRASREIADAPPAGPPRDLAAIRRALLITYRRDGTPVPTPTWAAEARGALYVRSERTSGKVKRLRNDARMLVAPCSARGKPLAPPMRATARVLARSEEPAAERALAGRYGLGRELFERTMDILRVDMCYLEITPEVRGE